MKSYRDIFHGECEQLQNMCESITDCHHSTPAYMDKGKLVIRNFNIKGGRMLLDNISFTDEEHFNQRVSRAKPESGDLIITREAPMGEVCIIPEGVECCLGQRMVLIKPDLKKVDNEYLLYSLLSEYAQIQIGKSNGTGSIVSNLRIPLLKELLVPTKGLIVQQKIGNTLGVIDKKIALNNKINAELEAMAKLIYDYWFVQFDFPDANGKPYKSSGGKMVYNEALKREIPDEWNLMPLEGIVDVISDTVTPSDICSKTAYIGLEHIPRKTIILSDWETAEKVDSNKSKCKKMDILFGKIRPYFHKVGICFVDGITSTDTIVLRAKEKKLQGIALQTVFTEHFVESATNSSTGTKMPRANWTVLKNYKTPMPPNELLCKYQSLFDDIVAKIEVSIYQNKELTELRDWLLPMLMNGQVTVNDS